MPIRPDLLITEDRLPEQVDVVVVGAGSAGSVVASRLSQRPGRRVLLVEAGSALPTEKSATPGDAFAALSPDNLHAATTPPQHALDGRTITLATGSGLGGSSSVNLLAWFHGHPADYRGWAGSGAAGWDWNDVQPVFRRIEDHAGGPDRFHGAGGPMVIDAPRDLEPSHLALLAAGAEIGLPVTRDFNGEHRTGVGIVPVNVRDGRRHGVVDGYLNPAAGRDNLRAALGIRVARVLIERGRAVGVVLGSGQVVRAEERVVLTAGALRTPQLLMLSGIGPAQHLREHGIEVVLDSPRVGQGLQDHPMVPAVWAITSGRTYLDAHDEASVRAYRLSRRGPLAHFATVGAMLPLSEDGPAPSVQALFYLLGLDGRMRPLARPAATATISLLTPHSRGSVRLSSADIADEPVVDPNYLGDPRDLPRLRQGVERIQELMRAHALDEIVGERLFPPPDAAGPEIDDWIRANVQTQWHPTGTVRIGRDATLPADERLAIRGVAGLSVADASVMPSVPRGNTQAPTIMVAERAASFIDG
ncbi:GMC family oxidoreductase N-terminal domain-containing protein [Streptomyces sp. NPDC023723]|uniref:GMC family oxidoreductase n=1 Tax=Streptomyces sp. NPDC023723 TaxID=3154323 RepID=UPI0033F74A18